jgi:hypothetical protein
LVFLQDRDSKLHFEGQLVEHRSLEYIVTAFLQKLMVMRTYHLCLLAGISLWFFACSSDSSSSNPVPGQEVAGNGGQNGGVGHAGDGNGQAGVAGQAGQTAGQGGQSGMSGGQVAGGLSIVFPPPSATIADSILVRGVVSGGSSLPVKVNGKEASSSDGFQTWKVEIPLMMGANAIHVESGTQNADVDVARFANEEEMARGTGSWPGRAMGVVYDSAKHRALVTDDVHDGVYAVDLTLGNRSEISRSEGENIGEGFEIVQPTAIDVFGTKATLDDGEVLVDVDLNNGNRTVIADSGTIGTGPALGSISAIGKQSNKLMILSYDGFVFNVDPTSLKRTVLSDGSHGTGPSLHNAHAGVFDWEHNRLLVLRQYQNSMWTVDLNNGNRTQILQSSPSFNGPEAVAWMPNEGAFVWTSDQGMLRINVDTGQRTKVTAKGVSLRGLKALSSSPIGLMAVVYVPDWEPAPQRAPVLVVMDPQEGTTVAVAR